MWCGVWYVVEGVVCGVGVVVCGGGCGGVWCRCGGVWYVVEGVWCGGACGGVWWSVWWRVCGGVWWCVVVCGGGGGVRVEAVHLGFFPFVEVQQTHTFHTCMIYLWLV